MSYVPGLPLAPAFVCQFDCCGCYVRQPWFLMAVPPSSRAAFISVWYRSFLFTIEDRCEGVERRHSSLPRADVICILFRSCVSEVAVMTAVLSAPFLSVVSAVYCWDVHSSRLSTSAFCSAEDQTPGPCAH